jgi:hypothetical protein
MGSEGMKKLELRFRELICAGVGLCLLVVVASVGIAGIGRISSAVGDVYDNQIEPLAKLHLASDHIQALRSQTSNVIIYPGDVKVIEAAEEQLNAVLPAFEALMDDYARAAAASGNLDEKDYGRITDLYRNFVKPGVFTIIDYSKQDRLSAGTVSMFDGNLGQVEMGINNMYHKHEAALNALDELSSKRSASLTAAVVIVTVISIVVFVALSLYLHGLNRRQTSAEEKEG